MRRERAMYWEGASMVQTLVVNDIFIGHLVVL